MRRGSARADLNSWSLFPGAAKDDYKVCGRSPKWGKLPTSPLLLPPLKCRRDPDGLRMTVCYRRKPDTISVGGSAKSDAGDTTDPPVTLCEQVRGKSTPSGPNFKLGHYAQTNCRLTRRIAFVAVRHIHARDGPIFQPTATAAIADEALPIDLSVRTASQTTSRLPCCALAVSR
jgi:hypothetical protein